MAAATTPPAIQTPSGAPTAKEKKYDRQLRLWAASGQEALENAKILLFNNGPGVVGIEALKNLILPGIGSFTIVDPATVQEEDLGVNFFLTEESLGKSRAEECARYLRELNPEVQGTGITQPFDLHADFKNYTLALATSPSSDLQAISAICAANSIPLFYVHSLGFYSHFSIQLPSSFPIVDTHPDPASTQDLRLLTPWPELIQYALQNTQNIDRLSDHDHGHVPYLLLLLHYLDKWKESHDGKPPQNYGEKKEFKVLMEKSARTSNPEGGEENYDEASAAVLKSLNPPSISSGLREVFEADECQNPSTTSANFWLIANAIKTFHSNHGALPLPGAVPDMKAQSADYIQLQNIYKQKARQDVAEVTFLVREAENHFQRTQSIDDKEIEAFCKGAAFVKLIRGRPLRFAPSPPFTASNGNKKVRLSDTDWSDVASGLSVQFMMQEESLLPLYLAFLTYDRYLSRSSGSDAQASVNYDEIVEETKTVIQTIAKTTGCEDTSVLEAKAVNVVKEFERAEGAELHNISALTGGMVAQEVIKVVTKQYVPVDNACVFDGITSKSAVFRV